MRLLVLGGSKFLGRQVVQTALDCGHEVTMFNRGRTNPGLFPEVRRLVGDRDTGDVAALAAGEWDGVADFSGFLPGQVEAVANVVGDRVGHYIFMSSIAVYRDLDRAGLAEDAPLLDWVPGAPEVWNMDNYGALKVGCERVVADAFPGRSSCLRSGFILGPHGYDLGHWGADLAAGRDVSCSLRPEHPIQILDSRDLAEFVLCAIESGVDGPMNVVGPPSVVGEVAAAWTGCVPGASVRWAGGGDDLGLSPDDDPGTFRLSNSRAVDAGLRLRPAEETARDYLDWIRSGGTPPPPPH
ncbi:MAG TPA: hypothetical protein VHC49_03035 [Mycobacteriales bacterium]|nr:hypothetical protein [Mycobacteriales bacterium]